MDAFGRGKPAPTTIMAKKQSKADKPLVLTCMVKADSLSSDSRKIICECQQYEQECVNRIWARWLAESLKSGKDTDLRIFLGLYKLWKDDGKVGPSPKPEFFAVEPDFQKRITAELQEAYPGYNSRCIALTAQRVIGNIKNNASHTGGLKLWQAVLLSKERLAASDGAIAVPFDSANGSLEWSDGEAWLGLRIDRYEVADRRNAKSNVVSMRLLTGSAKKRHRILIEQAAQGLRKWRGSKIRYDRKRRAFMVGVVIEADPPKPAIGGTTIATLTAPEKDCCWRLTMGDRNVEIGSGRSIAHLRQRLALAKSVCGRPDFPGNGRIGHGRKRLLKGYSRMTGLWENKTRTWNSQAVATILRLCAAEGIGTVRMTNPTNNSVLNTAGGGIGPSWPTFDFQQKLERKAKEVGIVVEFCDGKTEAMGDASTSCDESVA